MPTHLAFATEEDMLSWYPQLDKLFPRVDAKGNTRHNWQVELRKAMTEIECRLNARRDVTERFEIGRVGLRDQEALRNPCACLAIYFLFLGNDSHGDVGLFYAQKASQFERLADTQIERVTLAMDYDSDGDGKIDDVEKSQPFPTRFIRG